MKRNVAALAILSSLLLFVTSCGANGTVLAVEPATASAAVGEMVSVPVNISGVANLTAFEIHLSFDPNTLEVVDVTNGGFLHADFVVQNTFDNAAGTLDYAVAQMTQPPVSGDGTLLTIVFRVKAPGSAPINFRETPAALQGALLSDSEGKAIQVSLVNGSLDIK